MNKGLYVVHLHEIEDSYPFGVFDSTEELGKALEECFKDNVGNPWKSEYLNALNGIQLGESRGIDVETSEWGWNIYVVVLYIELNSWFKETKEQI